MDHPISSLKQKLFSFEKINLTGFPRLRRYAQIAWLPVLLIVLFILQNQAFDSWLKIIQAPRFYTVRRSLSTLALGTLLYAPSLYLKKTFRHVYLFVASFAVFLFFSAEFLYYRYANAFLQASALKYFSQTESLTGTIKILLTSRLLFFAVGLGFVVAHGVYSSTRRSETFLNRREKLVLTALILIIVGVGYGTLLTLEKKEWGNDKRLYSALYDLNDFVAKTGIANFFVEDAVKFAFFEKSANPQDVALAQEWLAQDKPEVTPTNHFAAAKGKNIFYIQVESLDAGVINQSIDGQEITPNLNALAHQGYYFSNYYTQVTVGNTADAEFSTLNSLYPLPDSVAFVDRPENNYFALPSFLKTHGYYTTVLHGDVPTFWNRSNIYPQLGYDKWFSAVDFTPSRNIGFENLGDSDFFQQTIPKLQSLPQPFFATLITLSSHTPFILPSDLQKLNLTQANNLNDNQKNYLQSVRYVDQAIGDFFQSLKKTDLYTNSVFIIYGDHGSSTSIADALGSLPQTLPQLRNSQVPLIVLAPGTSISGTSTAPGSHIDLYPTVANLLGLSAPSSTVGQDLFNNPNPLYIHRNGITGQVEEVLSKDTTFTMASDGVFDDGTCTLNASQQKTSVHACQQAYDEGSQRLRISDAIVKGDLIKK
jgi:lipoteichoic acid synthase